MMDIHLNKNNLSDDIKAVRKIRNGNHGDLEMRLIWNDGNGVERTVRVIANGPNLWVTGYYHQDGTFIRFDGNGGAGVLNYAASDKGCYLTLDAVKGALGPLAGISVHHPFPTDFRPGKENAEVRTAYVMCVFLTSEMVRNELLEKSLLLGTRKADAIATWSDYVLMYKNWATVSKVLYKVESGNNYPTIYVADVKSMFNRLEAGVGSGDLTQNELDVYRCLIENPQIA